MTAPARGEPTDPSCHTVGMAEITLSGEPINTSGELPAVGAVAPRFVVVDSDLNELDSDQLRGGRIVLNIFPSIDTGICATSVREFNQRAADIEGVRVIGVSEDLPFALGRFCGAEGIDGVTTTSAFRSDFGEEYGGADHGQPHEGTAGAQRHRRR